MPNPKKKAARYLKSIKNDSKREQKLDSIQQRYYKQFDQFDMGSKVDGGEKDFDKNYNILKKAGKDTIFGMKQPLKKEKMDKNLKKEAKYDAKEAYNKNLSGKARLHYLENNIADRSFMSKHSHSK